MTSKEFKKYLEISPQYFIQYNGNSSVTDGWKLSIQGNTLDDSIELFESLIQIMANLDLSFKFGTQKLIDFKHPQQSHKLLTVYIPNKYNVFDIADILYDEIKNYRGGDTVKCPTSYKHFKGAIYYRNDRDKDGNYISAN